jgi:hypothetical protein
MDRHLNCFYTYNQSNELIEDNLTRALIVTLSWLSNTTRNSLLHKLKGVFPAFDFSTAKFSLHEIEFSPKIFRNQYIMTISTDLEYHLEKQYQSIDKTVIKYVLESNSLPPDVDIEIEHLLLKLKSGSIPDAWVYDSKINYCFLIESKAQDNQVDYSQIIRHAYKNFGIKDMDLLRDCTIRYSWYDFLDVFTTIGQFANEQEDILINSFAQYLGFFGYLSFQGFRFHKFPKKPDISFNFARMDKYATLFSFEKLKRSPKGRLVFGTDKQPLFSFENTVQALNLSFKYKGSNYHG